MKIKKKGNYLKAYCTENNELGTVFKVGDEMGSISIKTGKFHGATACMVELQEALDELNSEIKPGDLAYNPLSYCVMLIDNEDDIHYVNDTYFKINPKDLQLSIDNESVNIYFQPPTEKTDPLHVVYWHLDEVEEDASVAISIANAIQLFYTDPEKLLKTIAVTKPAY